MVRGLLDEDGQPVVAGAEGGGGAGPRGEARNVGAKVGSREGGDAGGQVVRGDLGATSYVGGTHFAAILQDVSLTFPTAREKCECQRGPADLWNFTSRLMSSRRISIIPRWTRETRLGIPMRLPGLPSSFYFRRLSRVTERSCCLCYQRRA